jgi:hypothetical protein
LDARRDQTAHPARLALHDGPAPFARECYPRRYPQAGELPHPLQGGAIPDLFELAVIGSYVGTSLDSTDHGRQVLFEIYEMVFAEQDRRPAALSGLDHQDFIEVYQDFP